MLKGIDVSEHQGNINWSKVKGHVDFAIVRAGYGRNNIDKQFRNNARGCNSNNIPMGLYWFSYAYTSDMARQEAKYCIALAKQYKISYPICFDLEYDTVRYASTKGVTIGPNTASLMADAFCSEIEKAGYYAMNYANQDYFLNKFHSTIWSKYDLWYAWYNSNLNRKCGIWQYSESGRVPGINTGSVDMNYSYVDYRKYCDKSKKNNKEVYDMDEIVLYYGAMDAMGALFVSQKKECPMMSKAQFEKSNLKAKEKIYIGGKPNTDRFDSLKDAAKLV